LKRRETESVERQRRSRLESDALARQLSKLRIGDIRSGRGERRAAQQSFEETVATLQERFPTETAGLGPEMIYKMAPDLLDPRRATTTSDADWYREKYGIKGLSDAETINRGRARDASSLIEGRRPAAEEINDAQRNRLLSDYRRELSDREKAATEAVEQRKRVALDPNQPIDPNVDIFNLQPERVDSLAAWNAVLDRDVGVGLLTDAQAAQLRAAAPEVTGATAPEAPPAPPAPPTPEAGLSQEEITAIRNIVGGFPRDTQERLLREQGYSGDEIRVILGG
jgi:hypothetical protein